MKIIALAIFIFHSFSSYAQNNEDAILGKWETEKGNCIVQVYKQSNEYKAKVVWFSGKGNKNMNNWTDEKNPNKLLRSKKLLGMDVVHNLRYNADDNEWEDGIIYDPTSGKEWDSVVWITKDNLLKVKGYWVFKFLSETQTFKRI